MKKDLDENPVFLLIASLLLFWIVPLIPSYYEDSTSRFFLNLFPAIASVGSFGYTLKEMDESKANPTIGNYVLFALSGLLSAITVGRLFGWF